MEGIIEQAVPIVKNIVKLGPDIVKSTVEIANMKKKSHQYKILKDLHPEYEQVTFIRARDFDDSSEIAEKLLSKGYSVLSYDSHGILVYH